MKRILVLKAGETLAEVRTSFGDYDRWFVETLADTSARLEVAMPYQGQALPADPKRYAGVVMTGSPLSVTAPTPWMLAAADWMLGAAQKGVPVLGVCFGHQLLGRALGVRVVRNPRGREIGTIDVKLTPTGTADPLFAGLPPGLTVQATHEDIVESVPDGAQLLATNALAPVQAFRARRALWGVQFHPELSATGMAALIRARAERLDEEGRAAGELAGERVRRLLAGLLPSPHGRLVLRNFVERICRAV